MELVFLSKDAEMTSLWERRSSGSETTFAHDLTPLVDGAQATRELGVSRPRRLATPSL
jgi:hypothetical protein